MNNWKTSNGRGLYHMCNIYPSFDFKPQSNTWNPQINKVIQINRHISSSVTIYHTKFIQKCIAKMGPKCIDKYNFFIYYNYY